MKRVAIVAVTVGLASAAGVSAQTVSRESVVVSRSTQQSRTWYEAGTPVELHDVDRAARTLRVAGIDQTLVVERGADAGFDALATGAPVLLSWRFNRDAQPEAVLRVLTDRGAVTMVARQARDASAAGMARR